MLKNLDKNQQAMFYKLLQGFSLKHASEPPENRLNEAQLANIGAVFVKLIEYQLITLNFDIE